MVCTLLSPARIYLTYVTTFKSTRIVARFISCIHNFNDHRAYLRRSDSAPYVTLRYAVSNRTHTRNTTYGRSIQNYDVTEEKTGEHLSPSSDGRACCRVRRRLYGPKVRTLSWLTCCRNIKTIPEPPSPIEPRPGPSEAPSPSVNQSRHTADISTSSEPPWSLNEPPPGPSEAPSHSAKRTCTDQLPDDVRLRQKLAKIEKECKNLRAEVFWLKLSEQKLIDLEYHCEAVGDEMDSLKWEMERLNSEVEALWEVVLNSDQSGMLPTPKA
jgi:hypothetical protein